MKKNKGESSKKVVRGSACKTCGTTIYYKMTKTKYKCVLCRSTHIDRGK